jgi:hypothetical protein
MRFGRFGGGGDAQASAFEGVSHRQGLVPYLPIARFASVTDREDASEDHGSERAHGPDEVLPIVFDTEERETANAPGDIPERKQRRQLSSTVLLRPVVDGIDDTPLPLDVCIREIRDSRAEDGRVDDEFRIGSQLAGLMHPAELCEVHPITHFRRCRISKLRDALWLPERPRNDERMSIHIGLRLFDPFFLTNKDRCERDQAGNDHTCDIQSFHGRKLEGELPLFSP